MKPNEAMKKLDKDIIAALPIPERGNRIHFFAGAKVEGKTIPSGFGVRVTAAGARAFIFNYRDRVRHIERRLTIGSWPDWNVPRAAREARELRQRVDRGEDPLGERRQKRAAAVAAEKDTLGAVCEEYMRREGGKLRSKAYRARALERLIYPTLGNRPIADIKRSDIVRLLDKIEDGSGPVMADRALAVIRKIFNWHASRSDEFNSPIVRGMARTSGKDRARSRILSDDELRAVWKAAEHGGLFGSLVMFILLTGARRCEASEMRWSEIEGADWTLPASRNKTNVDLLRPLSKAALAVLPKRLDGSDLVFTTDRTSPFSNFNKAKRGFDKACGVTGWTLHDLRRTARSLMSRAGVPSDHAERCLGHTIGGVRGIYDRHEYRQEKAHAYELLASEIDRVLNPPPANVTPLRKSRAKV